jgi:hypothetical protein
MKGNHVVDQISFFKCFAIPKEFLLIVVKIILIFVLLHRTLLDPGDATANIDY